MGGRNRPRIPSLMVDDDEDILISRIIFAPVKSTNRASYYVELKVLSRPCKYTTSSSL